MPDLMARLTVVADFCVGAEKNIKMADLVWSIDRVDYKIPKSPSTLLHGG